MNQRRRCPSQLETAVKCLAPPSVGAERDHELDVFVARAGRSQVVQGPKERNRRSAGVRARRFWLHAARLHESRDLATQCTRDIRHHPAVIARADDDQPAQGATSLRSSGSSIAWPRMASTILGPAWPSP